MKVIVAGADVEDSFILEVGLGGKSSDDVEVRVSVVVQLPSDSEPLEVEVVGESVEDIVLVEVALGVGKEDGLRIEAERHVCGFVVSAGV